MENGDSIFLNIVTQRQSMYEECSISKVPTAIIFVYQAICFVEVSTDCNRGNMQQIVQQSVNQAIYGINLCAVVMIVVTLSCRKLCGVTQFI